MIEKLITLLAGWIIGVISSLGYGGIVLLMAIESACIPLPSEIIMPFSGYLVFRGEMTLWGVALAGAVGCVLGSIPAYYLGMFGGRPLVEKYGKWVLISHHDLHLADLDPRRLVTLLQTNRHARMSGPDKLRVTIQQHHLAPHVDFVKRLLQALE